MSTVKLQDGTRLTFDCDDHGGAVVTIAPGNGAGGQTVIMDDYVLEGLCLSLLRQRWRSAEPYVANPTIAIRRLGLDWEFSLPIGEGDANVCVRVSKEHAERIAQLITANTAERAA